MQRLTILIYHRVLAEPDPIMRLLPDKRLFERQLDTVRRMFDVLPLTEAVGRLRERRLARPSACITFDDGYADNHEIAFDLLRRKGLPATFFVTAGFLDGGVMWNDRITEALRRAVGSTIDLSAVGLGVRRIGTVDERRDLVRHVVSSFKYLGQAERRDAVDALVAATGATIPRMMMSPAQVLALRAGGMEIGGHTVSHPILARTSSDCAAREIVEGKRRLEAILGESITAFAYPNGQPSTDYTSEHVRLVREAGFEIAVSTAAGVATPASDVLQLPRFVPWPRSTVRLGVELVRNLFRTHASVA